MFSNRTAMERKSGSVFAWCACAWMAVFCLSAVLRSAETNAPPNEISIPKSVFVANDLSGKDPFFPNSSRRRPVTPVTNPNTNQPPPKLTYNQMLSLSGVTVGATSIATINGLTFAEGDEQEVKVLGGDKITIKVIKIEAKAVQVRVPGEPNPVVLVLPGKELKMNEDP
jgi:hypothetical protein